MGARRTPDLAPGFAWAPWAGFALVLALLVWRFPWWHVVPLMSPARAEPTAAHFDPADFTARFWQDKLPSLRARAVDARELVTGLQRDPAKAVRTFAHAAGLGTAYYHVHGTGRISAVERNRIIVAVDGTDGGSLALQTGAIFGNTVRDGLAVLNVNDFPSLTEFNALSAELNRNVEQRVLPDLQRQAVVGATVEFTGCAEATEPIAGRPLLTVIPVFAEVRPAR